MGCVVYWILGYLHHTYSPHQYDRFVLLGDIFFFTAYFSCGRHKFGWNQIKRKTNSASDDDDDDDNNDVCQQRNGRCPKEQPLHKKLIMKSVFSPYNGFTHGNVCLLVVASFSFFYSKIRMCELRQQQCQQTNNAMVLEKVEATTRSM